jgi:hypothetical protein
MNLLKIKILAIIFLAIGIPLLNGSKFLLNLTHPKSHSGSFIEKPFEFLLIDEYRFFSPNIADGYILLITSLPDGKIIPISVSSSEFINRLHSVYHTIDMQRETAGALMHSLAVYVLCSYPNIRAINMKLLEYKLPKISDYADDKIGYELVYENTYKY